MFRLVIMEPSLFRIFLFVDLYLPFIMKMTDDINLLTAYVFNT